MSENESVARWIEAQHAFLAHDQHRLAAALARLSTALPALAPMVPAMLKAAAHRRTAELAAADAALVDVATPTLLAAWPPLAPALALLRIDLATLADANTSLAVCARAARGGLSDEARDHLLDQLNALDWRLRARRAPAGLRDTLSRLQDQLEQPLTPEARFARARAAAERADFEAVLRLLSEPAIGPAPSLRQNVQYLRDFALREQNALQSRLRPLVAEGHAEPGRLMGATSKIAPGDVGTLAGRVLLTPLTRLQGSAALLHSVAALTGALELLGQTPLVEQLPSLESPTPWPPPTPEPRDPDDTALALAAPALAALATAVASAHQALLSGDYRAARATLASVEQRLTQGAGGLPLPSITEGLRGLLAAFAAAEAQLSSSQAQLARGARALQAGDLGAARAVVAALRADGPGRAVVVPLTELEQEIRTVEAEVGQLMAHAEAALRNRQDVQAAVQALRSAHRRWPGAPGLAAALEGALVRAGEAARGGDPQLALGFFEEALRLNPNNSVARAASAPIAASGRLRGELSRIAQQLAALHEQPDSRPEELAPLRDELLALQPTAADQPELAIRLRELNERMQRQQSGRRRFWELRTQAAASRDAGTWEVALAQFEGAVAALAAGPELPVPPWAQEELGRWRAAAEACAAAERDGLALRERARRLLPSVGSSAELASLEQLVGELEALIARAAAATIALGPLPARVVELQADLGELQGSLAELTTIFAAPAPQRLKLVQAALAARPDSALLVALQQRLGESLVDELPAYLERATAAEAQGTLAEARSALRDLLALAPGHPTATARLAALDQRQQIEQALDQAARAAALPSASLTQARDILAVALLQLLAPEAPTPPAVREPLGALVGSSDEAALGALASPAGWTAGLEQIARLRTNVHWLARRAAPLAERWLALAREAAVRGALATLAQLGAVLDAYALAAQYRRDHPTSEVALTYLVDAQSQLQAALRAAADKQLSRAEELLASGDAAAALGQIERLDAQYYRPIAERFPGLLDQLDDDAGTLTRQQGQAALLRERGTILAARAIEATALLKQAQAAFASDDLAAARSALRGLPDLRPLPPLQLLADELGSQLRVAEEQEATRQVSAALQRARLVLDRPASLERLEALDAELAELSQQPGWGQTSDTARQSWEKLRAQCGEKLLRAREAEAWQQEADLASDVGNKAREVDALARVVQLLDDPLARAAPARRHAELVSYLEQRARYDQAIAAGQAALFDGDGDAYTTALQFVLEATRAAAALDAAAQAESASLLIAARAGAQLERARARRAQGAGLVEGLAELLRAAQILAAPGARTPLNDELAAMVAAERERLEALLNGLETSLQRAREALAAGELAAANQAITEARRIDSADAGVVRLGAEIRQQFEAERLSAESLGLLQQAEQAWQGGNEAKATQLVQRLLEQMPGHPQGLALAAEIQAGAPGAAILDQAQALIFAGKFRAAEERLREAEAERLNPVRLKAVQRRLDDLKADYQAVNIYPIREAMREERFAEAFERIERELEKDLYDRLTQDLRALRAELLRVWPEQALRDAQERLRAAQTRADYEAVQVDLRRMLALLNEFPERPRVERCLRQAQIGQLNDQLRLIELALRYFLSGDTSRSAAELDQQTRQRLLEDAPASLEDARERAVLIDQETQRLGGLAQVRLRAEQLQRQIDEAISLRDERARQAERARSLAALRRQLEAAAALERPQPMRAALAVLRAALQPGNSPPALPPGDPELIPLRQQLDLLDRSADLMEQVEQALQVGDFGAAATMLASLAQPAPGLRPRLGELGQLIERLVVAEDAAQAQRWDAALAGYQQARTAMPELRLDDLLAARITHCQERLTGALLAETMPSLDPPHPALAGLSVRLAQALEAGWVAPARRAEVERLRDAVLQAQQLAEVERALSAVQPDLEAAQRALAAARRITGATGLSQVLLRWERLAQACSALQQLDLVEAQRVLDQLGTEERHPVVAVLRQQLGAAQGAARRRQLTALLAHAREQLEQDQLREAAETLAVAHGVGEDDEAALRDLDAVLGRRRELLQGVDAAIERSRALSGAGSWSEAAELLVANLPQAERYAPLLAAIGELQGGMGAAATALANQEAFGRAITLCRAARSLRPNPALDAQLSQLVAQRDRALERADRAAQAALAAWDRPVLAEVVARLEKIDPQGSYVSAWRAAGERIDLHAAEVLQLLGEGWELLDQFAAGSAGGGMAQLYGRVAALFDRAAARAPELREAAAWAVYAAQMQRGVELVPLAARNSATCAEAQAAFRTAAAALAELTAELRALPGGVQQARALRRRAIFNAEQLAQCAAELGAQLAQLEAAERAAEAEEAIAPGASPAAGTLRGLVQDVRRLRDRFVARSRIYSLSGSDEGTAETRTLPLDDRDAATWPEPGPG